MKRLLILPVVAVVCAVEVYRRGFAAPVLFGVRQWCRVERERKTVGRHAAAAPIT